MRPIASHWTALASASGFCAWAIAGGDSAARAADRPRYGGSLRVQIQARVGSLDPTSWPSATLDSFAAERITSLVLDRLVRLDASGPQPALAESWQHEGGQRRWEFRLRPGVRFSDGEPLTPMSVVSSLAAQYEGWALSASAQGVVIEPGEPSPDLPALLAVGRSFVYKRTGDGGLVGTGPFRIAKWSPGHRVVLSANEEAWEGRPFVDEVEVEMGRAGRDQIADLELGRADIAAVDPSEVRHVRGGLKVWTGAPLELLALVFAGREERPEASQTFQALARSIDRTALAVLLGKQGEPAGGLLPAWLSGHAFLFSEAREGDPSPLRAGASKELTLGHEPEDVLARAVAERISVDASRVGLSVRVRASPPLGPPPVDVRLVRTRIRFLDPASALEDLLVELHLDESPMRRTSGPEALWEDERAALERGRVVPLAHLPETYVLGRRVRHFHPSTHIWGAWRLEDVWLAEVNP